MTLADQQEFRDVIGRFASGVTIITTSVDGAPFGTTASAVSSLSLEPPMVLICIEKTTVSHYAFEESGVFVVNILRDSQASASQRFADPSVDKFEDVEFEPGIDGVPVLKDALASLECRLTFSYHGGDHSIFVAQVENVIVREGDPLIYFRGEYGTI